MPTVGKPPLPYSRLDWPERRPKENKAMDDIFWGLDPKAYPDKAIMETFRQEGKSPEFLKQIEEKLDEIRGRALKKTPVTA